MRSCLVPINNHLVKVIKFQTYFSLTSVRVDHAVFWVKGRTVKNLWMTIVATNFVCSRCGNLKIQQTNILGYSIKFLGTKFFWNTCKLIKSHRVKLLNVWLSLVLLCGFHAYNLFCIFKPSSWVVLNVTNWNRTEENVSE